MYSQISFVIPNLFLLNVKINILDIKVLCRQKDVQDQLIIILWTFLFKTHDLSSTK